jgi:hypothetical protein
VSATDPAKYAELWVRPPTLKGAVLIVVPDRLLRNGVPELTRLPSMKNCTPEANELPL